jgi:hypothetical protein
MNRILEGGGAGFYPKSRSNTAEGFFLAGREMSAWIAGLQFSFRQPGETALKLRFTSPMELRS